jgi:hypothetical protein
MNPEEEKELAQMTLDTEQAAVLLNRLGPQLKTTLGYRDVPEKIMCALFNAQMELDTAIQRYTSMDEESAPLK